MRLRRIVLVGTPFSLVFALVCSPFSARESVAQDSLDARVEAFLGAREGGWRDMNVPARDGQFLHDMIVERGYTRALEIGTSTGHSTIWIAWAMSKPGGKAPTLEIDARRPRVAV